MIIVLAAIGCALENLFIPSYYGIKTAPFKPVPIPLNIFDSELKIVDSKLPYLVQRVESNELLSLAKITPHLRTRQMILGQKYECYVPSGQAKKDIEWWAPLQTELTDQNQVKQLISILRGFCAIYKETYFNYKFCSQAEVRQQDRITSVINGQKPMFQSILLGKAKSSFIFKKTAAQFFRENGSEASLQSYQFVYDGKLQQLRLDNHTVFFHPRLVLRRDNDSTVFRSDPFYDHQRLQVGATYKYFIASRLGQYKIWKSTDGLYFPRFVFNDTFILGGRQVRWPKFYQSPKHVFFTQLYSNGDQCTGIGPRSTTVEYGCGPYYLNITQISQDSPCEYSMRIESKYLCGVNEMRHRHYQDMQTKCVPLRMVST